MKVVPTVYVSDMAKALDFYCALSSDIRIRPQAKGWSELEIGGGLVAYIGVVLERFRK